MDTYWLTGKDGGVTTSSEIEFMDKHTYIPEFLQIITAGTPEDDLLNGFSP